MMFKVGDRVLDRETGYIGEIRRINLRRKFPIVVHFKSATRNHHLGGTISKDFLSDGRRSLTDNEPVLRKI